MFEIHFKNNNNNNKIEVHQIVAKKESTAKQYIKQFLLHHKEYTLLLIKPC